MISIIIQKLIKKYSIELKTSKFDWKLNKIHENKSENQIELNFIYRLVIY